MRAGGCWKCAYLRGAVEGSVQGSIHGRSRSDRLTVNGALFEQGRVPVFVAGAQVGAVLLKQTRTVHGEAVSVQLIDVSKRTFAVDFWT